MRRVAELAGVPEVDPGRPLQEYGLGSRDAVVLAGELEELVGRALPATLLWETPTVDAIVAYLAAPPPEDGPRTEPVAEEDVAVVGIGCRFPGGVRGPAAYWDLLLAGGDAVTEVPAGRWAAFDDGSAEFAAVTRHGGFLDDVAGFDAEFFGISPAEAALMDPQQRLLLEVAWEALEHAGIPPATLAGSATGVFAGISASEYAHLTAADLTRVQPWTATGAAPSVAAGRLSYLLDLRGPSLAVDTACSSSLVAVDLAARSLRLGESDLAIAGGVNLMLSPAITMTFNAAGGTSPSGRCRAFDAAADGMVRGEGCGLVVLRRLSDARRAGDRVLAVLRGGAVNADGRSNGLVAPNPQAQRALLRTALARTGSAPADVDYVEAHGTGTPLGDPIEAGALSAVLGAGRERPLLLGSVKTNLGHLEAAAGAAGLIKTVLALAHRRIPASLHFRSPNPEMPYAGLEVVTSARDWPETGDRPPRAGVSSFGFSGVNAHLIVEGAAAEAAPRGCPVPVMTYVLHDRTPSRLRAQAWGLAEHLDGASAEPGDVAYTLVRRAGRGTERAAVTARTGAELVAGLRALADGAPHAGVVSGRARSGGRGPVFVFAGQGSQWAGMGAALVRDEPVFAEAIDEIDGLLRPYVPFSVRDVLDRGAEPPGVLGTQVTLFAVQVGLARLWHAYGVRPAAVIGQSMGEVAAAVASGGLSLADGVRVLATRAALLEDLSGHGAMAVLGMGAAELAGLAPDAGGEAGADPGADPGADAVSPAGAASAPDAASALDLVPGPGAGEEARASGAEPEIGAVPGWPGVFVAVEASPEETVVTGEAGAVEAIVACVAGRGRLARLVRAQGAGHSPQVVPLLPELRRRLDGVAGGAPATPWYSTVHADPRRTPRFDAAHWAANLRAPVRLAAAVRAAAEDGYTAFVEISAHPVLARALRAGLGADAVIGHSLRRGADDTVEFHTRLAALHVAGVLPPPRPGPGRLVDLPPAPWRHVPHWVSPPRRRAGEHRLLGAHVPLPDGGHVWRGALEGSAERRMLTLGLAAEIAYAAAGGPVEVRDLRLHAFLPLSEDAPAEVTTSLGDGRLTVSARDAGGAWTTYVTGRVTRIGAGPGTAPSGLDDLLRQAAPDGEPVGVDELRMSGDGVAATGVESRPIARWELADPLPAKLFEIAWHRADIPDGPRRTVAVHGPVDPSFTTALPEAGPQSAPEDCTDLILFADVQPEPIQADPAQASGPASASGVGGGSAPADRKPRSGSAPVPGTPGPGVVLAVSRLVAEVGERAPRVWVVTRDGRAGWLRGLVRTLGFEHPALRVTLLDVSDPGDLAREIRAGASDDEVRWRDGVRYVARLARATRDHRPLDVHLDGPYLITGGLGGLGLAVARYLAARGARRLVLNARSAPSGPARAAIGELRDQGVRVDVVRGDAADPEVARRLVAAAGGARVRGVVHAAGVADDRMAVDIGAADLARVWHAKVATAESVNAALDAAGAVPDAWVGFSSAAAQLGSPGQGAYAAANARLDAIAAARGGTTIAWGTWAETGGARDDPIRALTPLTTREALEAFGVLAGTPGATGVLRLDAAAALAAFPEITGIPFFADVLGGTTRDDWPGADAVRSLPDAAARITARVRSRVAALVGIDPGHLTPDVALADLGVDSLIALRITNVLTHDLAIDLEPAALLTGTTLADLEAYVLTTFQPDAPPTPAPAAAPHPPKPAPRTTHEARPAPRPALRGADDAQGNRPDPERPGAPAEGSPDAPSAPALGGIEGGRDVRPARALGGAEGGPGVWSAPGEGGTDVRAPGTGERVLGARPPGRKSAFRLGSSGVVVPLQVAGELPPLYLAHPAGGDSSVYRQLVDLLGVDRPVFGLERLDGRLGVAERAARYLEVLPDRGPCLLGGWSFGGVLAYEMARQMDDPPEWVVMIDSGLPMPVEDENAHAARRFAGFGAYVSRTYRTDLGLDERELRRHDPDTQLALVLERSEAAGLDRVLSPAAWRHQRTSYEDTRALERYRPGPYGGRVLLYRATGETPWTVDDPRYAHRDPSRGFAPYCPGLTIVPVEGHHLNLLDPPHVDAIAAHLRGLEER